LVGRIILPFVMVILMGITPIPYEVQNAFHEAQTASNNQQASVVWSRLAKVVTWYPWRADLWELQGMNALQSEQYEDAIQSFLQAKLVGKLTLKGKLILGDAFMQIGDTQKAIETWEELRQEDGASEELFQRLEGAYDAMGDYQGRLGILEQWGEWQPENARILFRWGLWQASHKPEKGLEILLQAARQDRSLDAEVKILQVGVNSASNSGSLAYQLLLTGRAMSSLQEWAPAIEAYQQAIILDPGYADAWALLGEAQQHQKLDGEPAIQQALALDPNSLLAQAIQALYWQQNGNGEKAISLLQLIATQEPKNAIWPMDIAAIMAQKGDLADALEEYQQAVQLEPANPVTWRVLATFSVNYDFKVHEVGLPAARNAEILAPNDPINLDMLGQVLAAAQDMATAERFFLSTLKIDSQYAPAYLHLGLVYLSEGNETLAIQMLRHAVALAPSQSVGKQAQRVIDEYSH
jgi:tetratricopeptide (TPR) repeat protein